MKPLHLSFVSTTALASLALTLVAPSVAHAQFGWSQPSAAQPANSPGVQLATPETEQTTLASLAGKPLHGANGEELGFVGDFLLESASGRILFAVVPSGQGDAGETYRLVPFAAIDPASLAGPAWKARISREQWEQAGTIAAPRFLPRMTLNPEELQRYGSQYGIGQPTGGGAVDVVRAFSLRGLDVRAGNQSIGKVQDAAFDLQRQTAGALVESTRRFARGNQKFLVPFERLQIPDDVQGAVTTTLNLADFQQARAALASTGYGSASFPNGQAGGIPLAAVQQAIGTTSVQAVPEQRIVLRGTVENAQRKAEVERAAQQAAPGIRVDSEITVRGRW